MDRKEAGKAFVAKNIESVLNRIQQAAQRAGRDPETIRLIAVSKSQSIEKIRIAYSLGLRDFGENRVLEALPKLEELASLDAIQWHMIGHIQSRKARYVLPGFSLVHSVDRMKIAKKLDQYSRESDQKLRVLFECNVSGEETKEGWDLVDRSSWPGIIPVFKDIVSLQNLEVCGLMTMAPFSAEEWELRSIFRKLFDLKEFVSQRLPGNWDELSMGMTDDFEIAIEEGSTMVRIGRAIFGPRDQD